MEIQKKKDAKEGQQDSLEIAQDGHYQNSDKGSEPRIHQMSDVLEKDDNEGEKLDTLKTPHIPTWQLVSLYVSICFGLFLAFLDTSIMATAIYTIGVEFHSLSKVNWIAISYTLAYLGFTAIFASLSDVFGRRNTYIAASVIFLAASIGCGFAQSLDQLIALRTLQGVGGSGLYSIGFVILPEISPTRMLKMIGALAGAVVAVAGILGPVLGGVITNATTWRWIFWINAPFGVVPLALFIVALPSASQLRPAERRAAKYMDGLGFMLLIAASVPMVFALQHAGTTVVQNAKVWSAAVFIAPLIVSILCWIGLFGWEWFISRRVWTESISAIFPMRLAKHRVYVSAIIGTMLSGFIFFVAVYSLPIRFQVVNGHSALKSGIALLPMLGSSAIGSTVAGIVSGKNYKNVFPVMMTGSVLMLIGTATLSTLENTDHAQAKSYGLQVFIGLGFGLTISTSALIASFESEYRDSAIAQGIISQARMFGGSLGIATSTMVLGIKQRHQLIDTAILSGHQLESLQDAMSSLSLKQTNALRQVYTDSFNETMVVCSVIAGVAVCVTVGCWQRNPPSIEDRRKTQLLNEANRQKALRAGTA